MAIDIMEICTKYGDRLYAAAFNITRQRQDAEDAVQEALLRLFRSDKEFESEEHIKAWLIRVTINIAKSTCTSFWHRNRVPYEDYMEEIPFEDESDRDLMEAVLSLPDKYRIIVHLYYYEGYKTREIAGILKLSENTVKTRLLQSRKLLKTKLEGWQDEDI
ncbi:MAG: sigma-70 family RNA polymerase sigma factor [Lachnospiraceae bacterium]|nr:sigma-70 family RNA polymerase sigma factor [Lachnospiraceae bacterium]